MKKLIYTSSLLLIAVNSQAQPVIHGILNYNIGATIRNNNCDASWVAPGNNGPNVTWSFQNLVVTDTIRETVVDPSTTPYAAMFPVASYAIKDQHGHYDFILRNIFTGHVDNKLLGYADSAFGFVSTYPDAVFRSRTPFTYLDSVADDFTVMYGNTVGGGHVDMKADGYGTLLLPSGTYTNVLRIESRFHESDTIISGPALIVIDIKGLRYEWYDDLHRSPLMTWDSTSVISAGGSSENKSVSYLQNETITAIRDVPKNDLLLTGNLHNRTLTVRGDFEGDKKYNVSLLTLNGKTVYSNTFLANGKKWVGEIAQDLPSGIYLLRVSDGSTSTALIKLMKD